MSQTSEQEVIPQRLQYHLDKALESPDAADKNYHIRTALQFALSDTEV